MLNLSAKRTVVIGGGKVASRKIQQLLASQARVIVIAPKIHPSIRDWNNQGKIELHQREFRETDLENCFLLFIATDNLETNHSIAALARKKHIWVNVVDDPDYCDFIAPAVLRQGKLCLAVSTEGASPRLAAKIRDIIADFIDSDYGTWVNLLGEIRQLVMANCEDSSLRREILTQVAEEDILPLIKAGKIDLAKNRLLTIFQEKFKKINNAE